MSFDSTIFLIMTSKRKRVVLSLDKKVMIINCALYHGVSVRKLSDEYGIGEQTVRDLIKRKDEIFKFVSSAESTSLLSMRKTMKKSTLSDMESALYDWFKQKRAEGNSIPGPMICEKAKWIHENLKIEDPFSASKGWLFRFKTRHGIRQSDVRNKNLNDSAPTTTHNDEFNSIMSNMNLSPELMYKIDECDLFWKMLPINTFPEQSEKSAFGHESNKEHVGIMACSNAAGTHKIRLTVIGTTQIPCSLKGTEMKSLPCDYFCCTNASMNRDTFKTWFFDVFVPSVQKFQTEKGLSQNAILLLDDSTSRFEELALKTEDGQIFTYYLPPNLSSLIQPIDQSVISSLKRRYKKNLLSFIFQENFSDSIDDLLKNWTLKDAIFSVCDGWEGLPLSTLRLSWSNILGQKYEDLINTDEEDDIEACLQVAESIPDFINVDRDEIVDWLFKDENDEENPLSNNHIISKNDIPSTSQPANQRDDSESNDGDNFDLKNEIIEPSQAIEAINVLMGFCEQQNFDYHSLVSLRNIRTEVRRIIANNKKQKLIESYSQPQ